MAPLVCYLFATTAFCGFVHALAQSCANPDADVLILGAGMAGIMAAKTLYDNGTTNFIILEAMDRIGGRIRNAEVAGVTVELGANWIQGVNKNNLDSNPVMRLARRYGVEGFLSDYESRYVYNQTGGNITDVPQFRQRLDDYIEAAFVTAENISMTRRMDGQPDISAREGLGMAEWVPVSVEDDWIEWYYFDYFTAEPPDDSSFYGTTLIPAYADFDGDDDYFVTDQRGYVHIVNCIAKEFQDDRLHLNTSVTLIEWSDECVCATATEDGENKTYCAPYAILTFSIGVLQSNVVRFIPELPQWKRYVINMFSPAHYLPIFMEFEETFWDDNVQFIGHVHSNRGYYPVFQPLGQLLPGNPPILLATLTGDIANRIVRQSEAETITELTQVLREIYGTSVPEPISITVARWATNQFFQSSFNNLKIGGTEAYDILAIPLSRLYFSGEATSRYNTYVQGAYFAGMDSANDVLEAMAGESSATKLSTGTLWYLLYLLTIWLNTL